MACTVLIAPTVIGDEPNQGATTFHGSTAVTERALEVRVGCVHLVVRVDRVARIIEVPCAPLPMARPLVLGLGFDDDRPVVCISLSRQQRSDDDAIVKAVLLTTPARVGWALSVDEVFSLTTIVELSAMDRGATRGQLPPWVRRARTADGRVVGWIDADAMVRDLAEPEVVA